MRQLVVEVPKDSCRALRPEFRKRRLSPRLWLGTPEEGPSPKSAGAQTKPLQRRSGRRSLETDVGQRPRNRGRKAMGSRSWLAPFRELVDGCLRKATCAHVQPTVELSVEKDSLIIEQFSTRQRG